MHRTRNFGVGLVVFSVVYLACQAYGQRQEKPLKVDLDLVLVNVGVTNDNNEVVPNLSKDNFQIFEDKVEQEIEYFSTDTAPLSLGIIFDASHSMEKKMN